MASVVSQLTEKLSLCTCAKWQSRGWARDMCRWYILSE